MIAVSIATLAECRRSRRTALGLATAVETGLLVVAGPPLAAIRTGRMIVGLRMRMIMRMQMIVGMRQIVRMVAGEMTVAHRDGCLFLALRGDRAVVARAPRKDVFPETSATVPTVRRVANLAVAATLPQKVAGFPLALLRIGVGHETSLEQLSRRVRASGGTAGWRRVIAVLEAILEMPFDSCPAIVRLATVHDALVEKPLGAVLTALLAGRPIASCQTLFVGCRRSGFTLGDLLVRGIVAQLGHAPLEKLHGVALAALRAGARRRRLTTLEAMKQEFMTPRLAAVVLVRVSFLTLLYKGPGFACANLLAAGGRFSVAIVETHPQLLLKNGLTPTFAVIPLETLMLGFGGGSQTPMLAVVRGRPVTFLCEAVLERCLCPGRADFGLPAGFEALVVSPGGLPRAHLLAGRRGPALLETAPESYFSSGLALGRIRRAGSAVQAHGQTALEDLCGVQPATSFAVWRRGLHVAAPIAKRDGDGMTIFTAATPSEAVVFNLDLQHVATCRVDRDTVSPNTTRTQGGDKD